MILLRDGTNSITLTLDCSGSYQTLMYSNYIFDANVSKQMLVIIVEDEIVKNRHFPALFRNRMKFGTVVGMVLEITKMPGGN